MAEYIDRASLMGVLTSGEIQQSIKAMDGADAYNAFLTMVNEAPTAEVEEVRHGWWEDEYGGKYANPRYRCSVCREKAVYRFRLNLLDNWEAVQALTDYCPHCGARMDQEVNHER